MSEQLLKKIGTYWTGRAAGYSKVNQEELAGTQRRDWLEHIEIQIQKIWKDREKQSIHILDVGTGPGFFAIILAEAGYQVTAVDYTPAMLEQASGRCGRHEKEGHVYIQTFDPDHYVIKSVIDHDYYAFFKKEMSYRHLGNYPPYVYLCTVIYMHKDPSKAMQIAQDAKEFLSDLVVLGPIAISMRQQKARVRLVVKCKDRSLLNKRIWDLVHYHLSKKTTVKQDINMHPLGLEE